MLLGKYINKYYLKYGILFVIGIIALVVVDYIQLYIPQFLGEIVDIFDTESGLSPEDVSRIVQISLYVLLVAFGMFFGRVLWRITILRAAHKIEEDLRDEMFRKVERLSQRYFHENKVGSIMSWFTNDIETVQDYLAWGTIMLIDAIFMGILVIIKMVQLDWVLSAISFIPILLIVVWGFFVEKYMSMKWEQRQKNYDELYDFSQENFSGIRVIKAFVKETQELHAFAKVARKNRESNIKFARLSVVFDVLIEIIISIVIAMLMGFGGWFVYLGVTDQPFVIGNYTINLTSGQLISFLSYFDSLVWPMIALGQIVSMKSRAVGSMKRIDAFLGQNEEIYDRENAIELKDVKGQINFNHLSFKYSENKADQLKDITLEIKAGETVGIVGKIGCGKTTLVNSLCRLWNIEQGSIQIDGVNIMDATLKSLRDCLAYVPQDNFLFSDKIKNNIAFSDETMSDEDVIEAAKFSDVHKDIVDFAEGYDTISGERGVTLSGGQKQRISIARAYAKDAPILILDDSVSAVDVKTEEAILNNIKELRKGKTTLVVASRVSTVNHLDRIIVLNDGELEAFDTPENLMLVSATYKKMVFLQELEKEVEGGN